MEQVLSADVFYERGIAARREGQNEEAFAHFARAVSLIPRYPPARDELKVMSAECLAAINATMDRTQTIALLARAIEMDPLNDEARSRQARLLAERSGPPDLTRMCFIFHDSIRARAVHGEAYRRAIEFVTIGGVVGDVLEFGVLGGWSARLLCEIMRDTFNLNNIRLFDSFEGLPDITSAVDRDSYEIGGRNIWGDKMRFPADFLRQFGQPHQLHIRDRLAEIVRPERIFLHVGYYADSLQKPLNVKAAVVHLDCDLYQSTVDVLWGLFNQDALQDGCVLLFDDWNCNRANPNYGERRALREFLEGQKRFSASPWFTYGYNAAAFILHANTV
jgi:O-methyltransferase